MDSFQAKIGWKRMTKRKNKNFSICSVLTRRVIENLKKIKKPYYGFFTSQNKLEKAEKESK